MRRNRLFSVGVLIAGILSVSSTLLQTDTTPSTVLQHSSLQRRRLTQSACHIEKLTPGVKFDYRPVSSPNQLLTFRQCLDRHTAATREESRDAERAATGQLTVTFQGDNSFEALKAYNQQLRGTNLHPLAFAQPASTEDVAAVVQCCVTAGLRFAARNGGHHYEANSLLDGGVVIHLAKLRGFRIDKQAHTLTLGAGQQLVGVLLAQSPTRHVCHHQHQKTKPLVGKDGLLLSWCMPEYCQLHNRPRPVESLQMPCYLHATYA